MDYTLEEIYILVGREDKTASLTLKHGSESFNKYGQFVTVVFLYTQKEREELDKKIKSKPYTSTGVLKVRYLTGKLDKEQIKEIEHLGINSSDIETIYYFNYSTNNNTYHSKEIRQVETLKIPIRTEAKGGDYDWMYGFKKKLVSEGFGLAPSERNFYLGAKYYFEPDNLSEQEVEEIFLEGLNMHEDIEWEILTIKYFRGELSQEEGKKCLTLLNNKKKKAKELLDKYLNQAGSSLKKLIKVNVTQAAELLIRIEHFKDIRLNTHGAIPVYLDIDSYLHIYMRHVKEVQVNQHFEHKDNFQWDEEQVSFVMKEVIKIANKDIQQHFIANPDLRYSRYGDKSVYFQGDYYTFHIEPNGRVSTFHKNRKKKQN